MVSKVTGVQKPRRSSCEARLVGGQLLNALRFVLLRLLRLLARLLVRLLTLQIRLQRLLPCRRLLPTAGRG